MNEEISGLTEETFVPYLMAQDNLFMSFALAVARSHPDPAALLKAFEQTLAEDEEGLEVSVALLSDFSDFSDFSAFAESPDWELLDLGPPPAPARP